MKYLVLFCLINICTSSFGQEEKLSAAIEDMTMGRIAIAGDDVNEGKLMLLSGLDKLETFIIEEDSTAYKQSWIWTMKATGFCDLLEVSDLNDSLLSITWAKLSMEALAQSENLDPDESYFYDFYENHEKLKNACFSQAKRLESAGNFFRANQLFVIGVEAVENTIRLQPKDLFKASESFEKINDFDNAEKYLIKSLEIDSTYFDSNYKMGAQRFNEAALMNRIIEMSQPYSPEDNKATELPEGVSLHKYKTLLEESQVYMEKAHQAMPNHLKIINTLFSIYSRLELTKEYASLKSELERIKEKN